MKTEYQYINFKEVPNIKGTTSVWHVRSNSSGAVLSQIKWYGPWRQYCLYTFPNSIFNKGCLEDINDFITQLMDLRKNKI